MARSIIIDRNEADWLIELLEDCDPTKVGTWRHDIAAEIREQFGYPTRDQEAANNSKS